MTADLTHHRYARPEFREKIGPAEVEYLQLGVPNYHEGTIERVKERNARKRSGSSSSKHR